LVSKDSLFNSLSFETKFSLFGAVRGAQDAFARQNPAKKPKKSKVSSGPILGAGTVDIDSFFQKLPVLTH
jgi:hypothetical protein